MKMILANPRGFCAGVNMAIESLDRALALFGTPLYVYHEIVHNRPVVERFRKRGVIFVDAIEEVPEGPRCCTAPRRRPGHPRGRQRRRLRAIDATCPLVTKVHMEAVRFAKEGYTILLIGHEGHDEVLGTMGEAPHNMSWCRTRTRLRSWTCRQTPGWPILTQTTLSVDDANEIITVLQSRYPNVVGPSKDDICYATQNRQEAVKDLVPEVGCGPGAGQPEQLEQPAPGGTGRGRWASGRI